jgi:XTP/dITP diphosphohydrolase
MKSVEYRKARFKSALVYLDSGSRVPMCFEGEANGEIILNESSKKGEASFGFDPIFRPSGSTKTFAEMNIQEKNDFSHRAKAVRDFAAWYKKFQ